MIRLPNYQYNIVKGTAMIRLPNYPYDIYNTVQGIAMIRQSWRSEPLYPRLTLPPDPYLMILVLPQRISDQWFSDYQ